MKQKPIAAATQQAEPAEAPALPRDVHTGRGGSYIYDPVRKVREPAQTKQRDTAEGELGNE
ncbi:hypothetical protein ASD15_21925 [Massilia sp. Root351]|jgi:hypothetical protein|uniref:hypothetical protein n=1 Tax=Massilia sp. Root351 TaxID=1736522 RepID=UPI00070F6D95|nr:hypothetical protein [Massilia sp. Root351]KQV78474.1 hypothetical protein ASD15_21925 [Massilia sp. Root351]